MEVDRLFEIYNAFRLLGGKGNSRKVAELLGISTRTVQRYLKVLVKHGYVEPVRRGMRVYYRVIKPLTEEEARELVEKKGDYRREAPPYELGRRILNIIEEAGLKADLIGAAKIHFVVPTHTRITHDIDVLVVREHARALVALLKYSLGLVLEKERGVHVDYRLRHPIEDVKVDVVVDGFREEGRMVWDLSRVLRSGRLTFEHVILMTLTRRSFGVRTDAYDVAVSLPFMDIENFWRVYEELKEESPPLARRIPEHLLIVRDFILGEYSGRDADLLLEILDKLMENRGRVKERIYS